MQIPAGNNYFEKKTVKRLFSRVDNSPLITFRILLGFLLAFQCIRFIAEDKVYENFIQPPFTFNYIGFEFLQPLPGNGMYFYFGLMALLGLLIMVGAWYRISTISFTILWLGIYMMQKSDYNNHYYLVLLVCFLMCFMPANAYTSLDVKMDPEKKSISCPQWVPLVFIIQLAVIYFYAALGKLSGDWLSGKFIALQFARLSTHHFTGPFYSNHYFQLLICYGGILFDMFIIPLLLWKKTRPFALIFFCLFHLFNSYTFFIGIFPYLSMAMAIFFVNPEKLRSLLFFSKTPFIKNHNDPVHKTFTRQLFVAGLIAFILLQVALPMRPWFYPGNVFWTEEGYRMSWKMMLRIKTGNIHFKVSDPVSGNKWIINPSEKFSRLHVNCLAISPDIIWQYAQRIKKEFNSKGYPGIKVFAIDSVSLNNNPRQLFIDTTVDLAAVKWQPFKHSEWIMKYK